MSWGFELYLNLGFSGGGGCPGMSKAPVRSACLGMLADIARPESNGEVTNGIFLAIFLGRLQALVTLVAAAIRPEIEGHSTSSLIQSLAEPQRHGQSLSVGYIAGSRTPRCSFRIGILAHSAAGFAQGYDFVTAAALRARVSICSQGNSNPTGDSRFCGVPNP